MYPSMDFAQQIPSLADFARMRRSLMEHMGVWESLLQVQMGMSEGELGTKLDST